MNAVEKIAKLFGRHLIDRVAYLPCSKLNPLTNKLSGQIDFWNITKESSGLPMCFGYNLGGGKSCMLIQNTAIGNLITELLTLPELYQVPLPIFFSWRGHYKEPIEAQIILGSKMEAILQSLGIDYTIVETEEDIPLIDSGLEKCFTKRNTHVFLLSPQVWSEFPPTKPNEIGFPSFESGDVSVKGFNGQPEHTRFDAIAHIATTLDDDEILIPQIGFPAREAFAVNDRMRNFYLLGALGSASLVGLGLATARSDLKVTVLDGDGAFLFNPNQMLELAKNPVNNLRVVILDNGSWGSTGNQPTMTSNGTNIALIGQACGMETWVRVSSAEDWIEVSKSDSKFIHYMIKPGNADVGTIDMKANEILKRFVNSIDSVS